MTRLRDSTKNAEHAVWPKVKEALARQATPVVIDKLARTKQSRSNIRYVVEETIQQIAAAGLLRTPADADVIGKAVAWHESHEGRAPEFHPDDAGASDEVTDVELYNAVEKMLDEIGDKPHA